MSPIPEKFLGSGRIPPYNSGRSRDRPKMIGPKNNQNDFSCSTSLTPIWRIASAMACPCDTRRSTCRSFATISSGLYRFLGIAVLLDVKDIPQVGPLQWGWIRLRDAVGAGQLCLRGALREALHGLTALMGCERRRATEAHAPDPGPCD